MDLKAFKKKLLQEDADFKKEYLNKNDLAFEVAEMVIDIRVERGLSQEELANLIGTKQPSIARIESGTRIANLETLQKIANALGCHLVPPKIVSNIIETKDNCFVFELEHIFKPSTRDVSSINFITKGLERKHEEFAFNVE